MAAGSFLSGAQMAYRTTQVRTIIADDQTLDQVDYDRQSTVYQTKDLQVSHVTKRVAPGDAEAQVSIAPVTAGYFIDVRSDYPVMLRLNGVSATQFIMKSNGVSPTNLGAPLPDQCVFVATMTVTRIDIAPISGATQTATVRIAVSGDPQSSYI
jgi:hypothetical protein